MNGNLKISALLQERMNEAISNAFGLTSTSTVASTAGQGKLKFKAIEQCYSQIQNLAKIYYRVDDNIPIGEFWVLSKRVVLMHSERQSQFVDVTVQAGYIPVVLDLANPFHQMLWMELWQSLSLPTKIPKPHRSQREGE